MTSFILLLEVDISKYMGTDGQAGTVKRAIPVCSADVHIYAEYTAIIWHIYLLINKLINNNN